PLIWLRPACSPPWDSCSLPTVLRSSPSSPARCCPMWIRSAFSAVGSASRLQWILAALVAAAVGGIALYVTRPQPAAPATTLAGSPDALQSSEIRTILQPDAIRAVDNPRFVAAGKAGMRDSSNVMGVVIGGEAHAYPIGFMSRVEIVNDRLGGTNIAV